MTAGSIALDLARTMESARAGLRSTGRFDRSVGPAQAGALLRLAAAGFAEVGGAAAAQQEAFAPVIADAFATGSPGAEVIRRPITEATLTRAAAGWFAENPSPEQAACAGYWLADLFLRGTQHEEIAPLARFLIGNSAIIPPVSRRTSVRRYPTGGISEKQALILPPILRALAEPMDWCSPFLVARRLAHTGGTLDKLAILPGFRPAAAAVLASWTGRELPVLYAAAGTELCPRDAAMYRIRGETGTVADLGLMAASILAKQAAAPVDALVIDILYGPTAFLRNSSEANSFAELCVTVGEELGLRVTPFLRAASGPLGYSIGASTELTEAVELLDPRSDAEVFEGELARALAFTEALAAGANRDPLVARSLATEVIVSGRARENLFALWRDHHVDEDFLKAVREDARVALLGDLHEIEISADRDGLLRWDWPALAAIVNERVNGFRPVGDGPPRLERGGVEVYQGTDVAVTKGSMLLTAYLAEPPEGLVEDFSNAFTISPM